MLTNVSTTVGYSEIAGLIAKIVRKHIKISIIHNSSLQKVLTHIKSFYKGDNEIYLHVQEHMSKGPVTVAIRLGHQTFIFHTQLVKDYLIIPHKIFNLPRSLFQPRNLTKVHNVRLVNKSDQKDVKNGQLVNISAGGLEIISSPSSTFEEQHEVMINHPNSFKVLFIADITFIRKELVQNRHHFSFRFDNWQTSEDGIRKMASIALLFKKDRSQTGHDQPVGSQSLNRIEST